MCGCHRLGRDVREYQQPDRCIVLVCFMGYKNIDERTPNSELRSYCNSINYSSIQFSNADLFSSAHNIKPRVEFNPAAAHWKHLETQIVAGNSHFTGVLCQNWHPFNYSMCVFLCISFPLCACVCVWYRICILNQECCAMWTVAAGFCVFITHICSYVCRWQSHMVPINAKSSPFAWWRVVPLFVLGFTTLWCSLAPTASSLHSLL